MNQAGGHGTLRRELGLAGAVITGLGSMLGTGVFVSIAIAAGIAGSWVLSAIAIAAAVAMCNALNSAQLAGAHPVSGGTYEYGYEFLGPAAGFAAGWMFLCAKSASAATAALGLAGYLSAMFNWPTSWHIAIALAMTVVMTVIVAGGMRRTRTVNFIVVSITIIGLVAFIIAGLVGGADAAQASDSTDTPAPVDAVSFTQSLLYATALMFVAYTGYGRIATLGEEVHDPGRTIPRAVVITVLVTAVLYLGVAGAAIVMVGPADFAAMIEQQVAPLASAAQTVDMHSLSWVVSVAAITAMLGVLLNLILGLSRVWLAMARRADAPRALARIDQQRSSPVAAVVLTGVVIAAIALVGDVKVTWTFSAFTVLVYYALTNLSALYLPPDHRRFGKWIAVVGLIACLALAFAVPWRIWAVGLGLLAIGFIWRAIMRTVQSTTDA